MPINVPPVNLKDMVSGLDATITPDGLRVTTTTSQKLTGFGNATAGFPKQVPVGITSVILLPANPNRAYAHIFNNGSQPVYVQYAAPAASSQGIRLNVGSFYTISGAELWLGSVNAVTASGTVNVDVMEGIY